MARQQKVNIGGGKTWGVGAGVFSDADIIIPIKQLEGMTVEQIGLAVRLLIPRTRFMQAEFLAGYIYDRYGKVWEEGQSKAHKIEAGTTHLKPLFKWALKTWSEWDTDLKLEEATGANLIQIALEIIEMHEKYLAYKESKPVKRKEIQQNYDHLFVKIGRRDGFKCTNCGSSDDLAIDHIIALAVGGTNDLGNLQLLCRSCNSSKGAR